MKVAESLPHAIAWLLLGCCGLGCVDGQDMPNPTFSSMPHLPDGQTSAVDAGRSTVPDAAPNSGTSGTGCDFLAQDCPGGQGGNLACYPAHGVGICQVITGFFPVGSLCSLNADCDRGLVCAAQSLSDNTITVCQPICDLGQAGSATCLDGQVCTRIGGFDVRSNAGYCTLP